MSKPKGNMKKLLDQRDQLLAEIEALRNKVSGLEMAISLMGGDDVSSDAPKTRNRRGNVKDILLKMLTEVGTNGLNASTAVEIAQRRGVDLDRGSVSSLLSRFKRDGIADYDGQNYRLKQFSPTE